ncbi:uncharacterized protein CANTADRAFT_46331 [Suhomyces tanzawaensis NRRL Y-17324]|uniref:ARM repeat-containing protein n=1 Tax=Suhomyces tanzawaensis NRRL Y-17324 TaxID=984487 RepID=A0A1E4SP24_9ASCO|nr:uncharacterized protein CANTADRAFT_46331 [Suhomyces tanzawaensis NRRL Y-17324]ODV81245.1 hypothetical protein CANTADRAFT_46331 [Suhomyces tanzawaensis NRRL Y-17324]
MSLSKLNASLEPATDFKRVPSYREVTPTPGASNPARAATLSPPSYNTKAQLSSPVVSTFTSASTLLPVAGSSRRRSTTTASIDSLNIQSIENIRNQASAAFSGFGSNRSESSINPESPTWLLSDLLASFSSVKDMDEYQIVAKGNSLVQLFQQNPNLKNDILMKNILNKILFMFQHHVSEVRSVGYRILRYLISNYESLVVLVQYKVLIYIIITMSTTRSLLVEKEQALKLIREFLTVENGSDYLSIGVIKSLIALIESNNESMDTSEDSFKTICVETICEISLLKPELIFHSGGFKIIINTIIDGSVEMSANCLFILFKLLDFKKSRHLLRNGYDLISIISVFSTLSEQDSESEEKKHEKNKFTVQRLQKASFLISILLKNFNGLMAFSIFNFRMLRDLLDNLRKKNNLVREFILDILFDVLRIKSLPWLAKSSIGDVIRLFNSYLNSESNDEVFNYSTINEDSFEYSLINHYRGLLTLILVKNGIFDLLVEIIDQNTNAKITSKATLLLTNLYAMCNNLLPLELIEKHLIFSNISSQSSFEIDKSTRNKFVPTRNYNASLKVHLRKINISSRYNIDDIEFKAMISNTRILTVKEFEDWNWSLLLILIQGPLSNPKRFEEVLEKSPKFFKRLMSFFRPFKFRFCNISVNSRNSSKFINIGCQLIELFLSLDAGVKYLATNKILPQLTEILAQMDPYSGITAKEPILSRKRLENSVSYGYLKFIGNFSGSAAGLALLEHWQIFTILQNIIDTSINNNNNNLFILTLFRSVDFSLDSQFRTILLKSFKVSNTKIKMFIIKELLPRLINDKQCEVFVIKMLVNSLYNPNTEIVQLLVNMLNNYYRSRSYHGMEFLISMNPSIYVLSTVKGGENLLVNFLSIPEGFKYLEDSGFIDNEFEKWVGMKDFSYLNRIERLIQESFYPFVGSTPSIISKVHLECDNGIPAQPIANSFCSLHFFKYLLSTEEGLNYFSNFKQRNYLDQIINEIEIISAQLKAQDGQAELDNRDYGHMCLINNLKQNLWIIGNIALGKYGIQLLDPLYSVTLKKNIIETIFELFESCTIWQIRGLCFYIIGMISSTIEGIEILDELEWVGVCDYYNKSKCLAYPKEDIADIFNVEISNPYRDRNYFWSRNGTSLDNKNKAGYFPGSSLYTQNLSTSSLDLVDVENEEDDFLSLNNLQKVNERIISQIHYLNSVLGKIERKAHKELLKIKKTTPEIFNSPHLFLEVVRVIDRGNFKFQKRKFIFELFLDTEVLESISRKERKNSMKQ